MEVLSAQIAVMASKSQNRQLCKRGSQAWACRRLQDQEEKKWSSILKQDLAKAQAEPGAQLSRRTLPVQSSSSDWQD